MQQNRWYDNNDNLREIIDALKITHHNNLEPLAFDIIQLMLEKQTNIDGFLEETNQDSIIKKHRWYDNNYMFHSAMEMLKQLPEHEAEILLKNMLSPLSYE